MTQSEFNRLVDKYHQGKASAEEKALLDAWFESIEGDESKFTWTKTDEDHQFKSIRGKIMGSDRPAKVVRLYPARWLQIAATILILITSAYAIWHIGFRNETLVVASVPGTPEKVILPDGTLVWLKGNSTLRFPERFDDGRRTVDLKGEALFEVAKDPLHPFVITCGMLNAKVLGTSFNIRTGDKNIEVMVLTGKVELSDSNDKNTVIVLPNQKVVYDGLPQAPQTLVAEAEKERAIKGTEYNMAFSDTDMETILERIEGKFGTQVTLENIELSRCLITADFTDQSLEDTLRMIAHILGFEYDIRGNAVTINGGGCE